jgi:two-component system, cell cycle response regulator DivK
MKKVLVIEDNEANMYLTKFILEKNGFSVLEERTGLSGIERAIQDKPDLILMDIQLPDINGMEATKRIRSSVLGNNVPIVAITSYAMTGDRDKTLEAGCNGYIEKPINPDTFMKEINKYC